jgi:hypothetical protein
MELQNRADTLCRNRRRKAGQCADPCAERRAERFAETRAKCFAEKKWQEDSNDGALGL